MKARDITIALFLALFSSSTVLGSLDIQRSSGRSEQNDFLLRFHTMVKEAEDEPVHDKLLSTLTQQNVAFRSQSLPKIEKSRTPSVYEELRHVDQITKMINTMKAEGSDRNLQDDACDPVLDIAFNCFESDPGCNATCISEILTIILATAGDSLSCSQFETGLCGSSISCGCEMCDAELAEYFDCGDDICKIQCGSTTSPTPEVKCPAEFELASACAPTNMKSCNACVASAHDAIVENGNTVSCTEITVGLCQAIKLDCDCGVCSELWQEVSLNTSA
jgi:hypothetical protein